MPYFTWIFNYKKKSSAEVTEPEEDAKKRTGAAAADAAVAVADADAHLFLQTSRASLIRPPPLHLDFQCLMSFARVCFSALPPLRQFGYHTIPQ